MKKNVLILSGSPRKGGNSDVHCDEFAKGAEKSGNSVEKIYLKDYKMGFCQASYACKKTGKCVQKDDMEAILDKMVKADVIVMATPAYFYTMDAQMKVLIDRTLPISLVENLITFHPSLFLMISVLIIAFIARRIGYKRTILAYIISIPIFILFAIFVPNVPTNKIIFKTETVNLMVGLGAMISRLLFGKLVKVIQGFTLPIALLLLAALL